MACAKSVIFARSADFLASSSHDEIIRVICSLFKYDDEPEETEGIHQERGLRPVSTIDIAYDERCTALSVSGAVRLWDGNIE